MNTTTEKSVCEDTPTHNRHLRLKIEQTASPAQIVGRLERLPVSWPHRRLLLIHGFGWLFDAMDVGLISFVIAAIRKEWTTLSATDLGWISSAGMFGMLFGAMISGYFADRWGRKFVFQITLLLASLATLACAFSWGLASMIILRVIVGIGLGGELPVVSSLLSEFIPAKKRGKYIVYLEMFWGFGWLAATLIGFLVVSQFGWRWAFILGGAPALFVWYLRQRLPESPRWLATKGHYDNAEAIMSRLEHEVERSTKQALPPVTATIHGQTAAYEKNTFAFLELWNSEFLRRTIMLSALWFGLSFGYYGIFIWLPSLLMKAGYSMINSFGYSVLITLAQIPGYLFAAWLVEKIGRKWVIFLFLLMSGFCAFMFGQAVLTGGEAQLYTILMWACLMSFFNLGAWGAVYTYTPENYPTRIRGTGSGFASASGRIGGILAPFTIPLLTVPGNEIRAFAVIAGALSLAGLVVLALGKETKGTIIE